MAVRTVTELLALYADNTAGDISALDLRDFVDSMAPVAARMSKTSSQTLTTVTENLITFDREEFDTDGALVDLANNRFVAQTEGPHLLSAVWLWESTVPPTATYMNLRVDGADVLPLGRIGNAGGANGGANVTQVAYLTAGDLVTLTINPQGTSGVTARGNAATHLSTSFAIARIGLPL